MLGSTQPGSAVGGGERGQAEAVDVEHERRAAASGGERLHGACASCSERSGARRGPEGGGGGRRPPALPRDVSIPRALHTAARVLSLI